MTKYPNTYNIEVNNILAVFGFVENTCACNTRKNKYEHNHCHRADNYSKME